MKIPTEALPYIKMQRTHFKEGENLIEFYEKDIREEFDRIRPLLPTTPCQQILDIGCGLGGIDHYLHSHYDSSLITMLDFDSVSKKLVYGFRPIAAHYNSVDIAKDMLQMNDLPILDFTFIAPGDLKRIRKDYIDLVISLYSWGYHYPLSTYLDQVYRVARPGATILLDLRINQSQLGQLYEDSRFTITYVGGVFNKCNHVVFTKGKNK